LVGRRRDRRLLSARSGNHIAECKYANLTAVLTRS
jgi:hypothetical protein